MATKKQLFEKATKIAESKTCFFIEQLAMHLGISKSTIYAKFKIGSNEMDAIKEILHANRAKAKTAMYKKWYDSENPTLQIAFMKLIGTEEEVHKLNGSRTENKNETVVYSAKVSKEEAREIANNLEEDC